MSTIEGFNYWQAIHLYCKKPHVINRRLAGIAEINTFELSSGDPAITNELVQKIQKAIQSIPSKGLLVDTSFLISFLSENGIHAKPISNWSAAGHDNDESRNRNGIIIVNKLLAKNLKLHSSCFELIILGKLSDTYQ